MHARTVIVVLVVVLTAAAGGLVACASSTPEPTLALQPTPTPEQPAADDGATILEDRCTRCHSLDRVIQGHKTREQWEQTVTRMVGKGVSLTEAERAALIDYLATTYGP